MILTNLGLVLGPLLLSVSATRPWTLNTPPPPFEEFWPRTPPPLKVARSKDFQIVHQSYQAICQIKGNSMRKVLVFIWYSYLT